MLHRQGSPHRHLVKTDQLTPSPAHDGRVQAMLECGKFVQAADYCMRRDYRAKRLAILAVLDGLRLTPTWHQTHRTRVSNLVRRGLEIGCLSPHKDENLRHELECAGIDIPAFKPEHLLS